MEAFPIFQFKVTCNIGPKKAIIKSENGILTYVYDYRRGLPCSSTLYNTKKSAQDIFDYDGKQFASNEQMCIVPSYSENVLRNIELGTTTYINTGELRISCDKNGIEKTDISNYIYIDSTCVPFIPGVPGSDGTHPRDIPLHGHKFYVKVWTGIKQT